jgi:hypothetical protein
VQKGEICGLEQVYVEAGSPLGGRIVKDACAEDRNTVGESAVTAV